MKLPAVVAYYQTIPGGGSREGTGYGVALGRLFELYRMWRDSTRRMSTSARSRPISPTHSTTGSTPPCRRSTATRRWATCRASRTPGSTTTTATWCSRRAPSRRPHRRSRARASWWLHQIAIDEMTGGFNFRDDLLPAGGAGTAPTALFHHATGAGVLFARRSWTTDALWMSFVAGPYVESHAHQDQGAFNLFRDDWLAVTENVFTHSGIQQGTEVHNTLRFVNGTTTIPQNESTSSMTVSDTGGILHVVANLTPAYANSGVVHSWQRTLDLDALGLTVHDSWSVAGGVTAVFQVNTPVAPIVSGGVVTAGALRIRPVTPANPAISVVHWNSLDPSEFNSGYKVELRGGTGQYQVRLELLDGLFADGFESGDTAAWVAQP